MSFHIDDSEYSVRHRKEIISILDGLKKGRVAIRLVTSHGEEFVTSILEINSEKERVYLDVSADERANSRVVESKPVIFSAQTGVSVKWHSAQTSLIKLPDGQAFSILLPAVVQRIQRREYFRIPLPQGSKGNICRIPVPEGVLDAPIRDMSAGGICIALRGPLHFVFSQGSMLDGCYIEFPGVGPVHFKLRVCNMRMSSATRDGEGIFHIGMEFTDMSRGVANVIQRYIIQLEGEK